MANEKNFELFNTFVLRTPLLPLNFYNELVKSEYSSDEFLISCLNRPFVMEAIAVASQSLYKELLKLRTGDKASDKKKGQLKISLLKYLTRMSTRSTPFGIFAGSCTGNFESQTNLVLAPKNQYLFTIRKNESNQYKGPKSKDLEDLLFKKKMLWFPNTSLYPFGDNWRYMELQLKSNEFEYTSEELSGDRFLEAVISSSRKGVYLDELNGHLQQMNIDSEDAINYIKELVHNQVLHPFDSRILINSDKQQFKVCSLGKNEIKNNIFNGSTKENICDLFTATENCQLNSSLKKDIIALANFMSRISPKKENKRLEKFKRDFVERYGESEIPLTRALDSEFGMDYLESNPFFGDSPLIAELDIKRKKKESHINLIFDSTTIVLNNKMQEAILTGSNFIELKDTDFDTNLLVKDQIANTFFAFSEITKMQGKDTMFINSFIGGNSARIISRFGFGDSNIQKIVDNLVEYEDAVLENNKVLAEIIHLPSLKASNIVRRSVNITYEIPYLGFSGKPPEFQIRVEDLLVSIVKDRIYLKSNRLDKEVIPVHTNAHNYENSPLPIYQFLCDVSFHDRKTYLGFDWGPLKSIYRYFPRVIYRSIIISKAKWTFRNEDIPGNHHRISIKGMDNWRNKYKLPQRVYLIDKDNKLLIDFKSLLSIEVFYHEIKNEKWVKLEESLNDEGTAVADGNANYYANEFLFFLKRC